MSIQEGKVKSEIFDSLLCIQRCISWKFNLYSTENSLKKFSDRFWVCSELSHFMHYFSLLQKRKEEIEVFLQVNVLMAFEKFK